MGGTSDEDVHALERLMLFCGDGVAACHGYVERFREYARARGLLVPHGVDPAGVPVELASGRLVLLEREGVFYREIGWRAPPRIVLSTDMPPG